MYTIKATSHRSGVAVATIRAWERRYRILAPARTESGYRLYDDAAIDRLIEMRRLVSSGWQPSVAAAMILERGPLDPAARETRRAAPGELEANGLVERLVRAAMTIDDRAADAVLDDLFSRGSFERVAGDLLFPALRAVGQAWADGSVSVAGEHLVANAVLRRLALALEAAGQAEDPAGRVIVGLPPGSRHELGAMAFAVAARRAGLSVAYLGPDLPVDDWITAAEGGAAAVIGVVTPRDRRAAIEVASRLRAAQPSLLVAVGGRAAPDVPGCIGLPDGLADAAAALAHAMAESRPTPPPG